MAWGSPHSPGGLRATGSGCSADVLDGGLSSCLPLPGGWGTVSLSIALPSRLRLDCDDPWDLGTAQGGQKD